MPWIASSQTCHPCMAVRAPDACCHQAGSRQLEEQTAAAVPQGHQYHSWEIPSESGTGLKWMQRQQASVPLRLGRCLLWH